MTFNYLNDWRLEDVAKTEAFWSDMRGSFEVIAANPIEVYVALTAFSVCFGLVVLRVLALNNLRTTKAAS